MQLVFKIMLAVPHKLKIFKYNLVFYFGTEFCKNKEVLWKQSNFELKL